MLGAVQSPNFKTLESEKHMSMLDWYVALVRSKAAELLSLTDILVADAFFSKYEFVNEVIGMGFRFVGEITCQLISEVSGHTGFSAPRRRGRKKSMERKWISPALTYPCSLHSYMRIPKETKPDVTRRSYIRGH